MYDKKNKKCILLYYIQFNNDVPRIPINSYSYSTRRWSRIFGGTDRCSHCHYIVAVIGLLHYPVSKSTTKTAEFSDSIEESIWLRHKYEGKTNYSRLISRETSNNWNLHFTGSTFKLNAWWDADRGNRQSCLTWRARRREHARVTYDGTI